MINPIPTAKERMGNDVPVILTEKPPAFKTKSRKLWSSVAIFKEATK
uniref:Uncharacterized protein n=1 Tax=Ciona intestinalis TaxID=7719 RepID=H2XT74_CIOIN